MTAAAHRSPASLSIATLDGAALDRAEPEAAAHRYFILSGRRTGSYMLCRMLIRAGVGIPHEYFNPRIMRRMAERWGVDPGGDAVSAAYLETLLARRSAGGFFGAKVQHWQYRRALESPQGEQLLRGARFIYLYREDLLKQAISFRHAEVTGRWGQDEPPTTKPKTDEDPLDPAAIDRNIDLLIKDERGWRSFIAKRGLEALHLSYEQMCADPGGALRRVLEHVGADPARAGDAVREHAAERSGDDAELKARMLKAYLARAANADAVSGGPGGSPGSI